MLRTTIIGINDKARLTRLSLHVLRIHLQHDDTMKIVLIYSVSVKYCFRVNISLGAVIKWKQTS